MKLTKEGALHAKKHRKDCLKCTQMRCCPIHCGHRYKQAKVDLKQVNDLAGGILGRAVDKMMFTDNPLATRVGWKEPKISRWQKLKPNIIFAISDFRIWLGEKISGQKFYDYED